jgi:hypothetical protein
MRVSELQNVTIGITPLANHPNNKVYRLTIQDHDTKEVLWVDLGKEVADQIVAMLTSGIVVPKLHGLDNFSKKV